MTTYLDVPSASTSGTATPAMLESGELQTGAIPLRDNYKGGSAVTRLESVITFALASHTKWSRFSEYMLEELDSDSSRIPLSVASFLSGFIGCVSFSACSIW